MCAHQQTGPGHLAAGIVCDVPNLDFYAFERDHRDVLEAVFRLGCFRVFEAYSEPDHDLREFTSADEVPIEPYGPHLMLYPIGAGPEPTIERLQLRPGAAGGGSFRFQCRGWGLVQLHFGGPFGHQELRWSHTNHNSQKRAAKWADVYPVLGNPDQWDWEAVPKASRRLNRAIRALAVDKIGSHPVLRSAAQLISRNNLMFEYGTGIHAEPSIGTRQESHESH